MITSNIRLRALAVAGLIGASISAHAWILTIAGTYTNPYTNFENLNITYKFSDLLGNNFSVNSIHYHYTTGVSAGGSADFSNGGNVLDLNFTGTDTFAGGTHSIAAVWTANTPPTTVAVVPTGTTTASFDGVGDFSWTFVGQSVPEPSAVAIVGIGVIGLLVRRRKR